MANLTDTDVIQSGTFDLWDALPDHTLLGGTIDGVYKEFTLALLRKQLAVTSQNEAPTVEMSVSTQAVELGEAVALMATAADPDGSVARVEFFDFSDKIGEATATPYVLSATPTTLGTHVYSAKATDNDGKSTQSGPTPVVVRAAGQVKADPPTSVSATVSGTSIVVNATPPANTGTGTVSGYEVFRNGQGFPLAANVPLPYTDTTPVAGTPYYYQLQTHTEAGDSLKSAASNTATVPTSGGGGGGTVAGPSYHGTVASPTPSTGDVLALTSEQWAQAARTISYNASGDYPAFAEPASYGVRTLIKDVNDFNVTGDVTRTAITLAGVAYNLYVHNNPQYDPAFILKF